MICMVQSLRFGQSKNHTLLEPGMAKFFPLCPSAWDLDLADLSAFFEQANGRYPLFLVVFKVCLQEVHSVDDSDILPMEAKRQPKNGMHFVTSSAS